MNHKSQSTKPQLNGDAYDDVFRKSTFSESSACVEVAKNADIIKVRDTKNRQGTVLSFTHAEWDAFLKGVRQGEFDL